MNLKITVEIKNRKFKRDVYVTADTEEECKRLVLEDVSREYEVPISDIKIV